MSDDGKTTGLGRYTSRHTATGLPSKPQNWFTRILGTVFMLWFLVPSVLIFVYGWALHVIILILLSPVIWLVEGRRRKVPPPEVVPPSAMQQTLPIPASEADAHSLEIQDQIEAESRQIAWEQIRAANAAKRGRSTRTSRRKAF